MIGSGLHGANGMNPVYLIPRLVVYGQDVIRLPTKDVALLVAFHKVHVAKTNQTLADRASDFKVAISCRSRGP